MEHIVVGNNDPGKGLQYVSAIGENFEESFTIASVFDGKLFPVSGLLEVETNLTGKWSVKANQDSAGNWRLYGNGWRNFVKDNFTEKMMIVHLIKTSSKSLYFTGYDFTGREINAVMGNGLRSEKCCVVGDDLPIIYQPMPIEFFKSYIDEALQEVCFLVNGTKYPSDILYSKDESLEVNVGIAVWGEVWEILCKDYDFKKGHVMIIWNIEDDLFGGKMFHTRVNNIYGIAKTWPNCIRYENADAIGLNHDVFDVAITNLATTEGVVLPEHFMMRHRIMGHVAAKLRYKGQPFKMNLKRFNNDVLKKDDNKNFGLFGDWPGFINDNGIAMHPVIEDGREVMKTVKLIFHLHTETLRNEFSILFDVYDF